MKVCTICGQEETDPISFVELNDKIVCELCFELAIRHLQRKIALQERGFYIQAGGRCDCCEDDYEDEPVFGILDKKYCILCVLASISYFMEELGKPKPKVPTLIDRPDKIDELVKDEKLKDALFRAILEKNKGYNA